MRNYYFLGAILPGLHLGYPPELTFSQLLDLLKTNLVARDFQQVVVIRRFYDLQNIRAFWEHKEISPFGNLDGHQLEEALLTQSDFPDYVFRFLDQYENNQKCLENFSELLVSYFREEGTAYQGGFLHDYLIFERSWRLVVSALRAKKMHRDIVREMQFEDPNDELVAQLLAQKDAAGYEPPSEFSDLKGIYALHAEEPYGFYKVLCDWRFAKIGELCGVGLFSIDRILGYLAKLITAEEWMALDKQQGLQLLKGL